MRDRLDEMAHWLRELSSGRYSQTPLSLAWRRMPDLPRTPLRVVLVVGLVVLAPIDAAQAQRSVLRAVTATANVADASVIVAVSPLTWYERLNTGDIKVRGTVTTTHNGPYALQAKISLASFEDAVLARTPNATYVMLTAASWVTVSTGPGGSNRVNSVDYWVNGRRTRRRDRRTPRQFR